VELQVVRNNGKVEIKTDAYCLTHDRARNMYVNLMFQCGIGAELFVPSGQCGIGAELFVPSGVDRDEWIDEIVALDAPKISRQSDHVDVSFTGRTTLWDKVEYIFQCFKDRLLYSYTVFGRGNLDNARFFEGFLKNDPRNDERRYPLYCGWGFLAGEILTMPGFSKAS